MKCPIFPPLETPPGDTASAKYVVVIDVNGEMKVLIRPTTKAVLYFDGDDAYWADGGPSFPIILDQIVSEDQSTSFFGVMCFGTDGSLHRLVNESPTALYLQSANGQLGFAAIGGPEEEQLLPQTGSGILIKHPITGTVSWDGTPGVAIVNTAGEAGTIANGTVDQIFKIDPSGVPVWANAPSGTVTAGSGSMGLDGVQGASLSVASANVTAPTFTLSDGATTLVVSNVNVTANLGLGVAVNGLDTGAEANNKWYYIHIITDGVNVDCIVSESATAPTMPGAYTHWALASVFRNDAAGNMRPFVQRGHSFSTLIVEMSADVAASTAFNAVPQSTAMTTIVPPLVKTVSGMAGGAATATQNRKMSIATTITGIGTQLIDAGAFGGLFEGFAQNAGNFQKIPIADPSAPGLFWKVLTNDAHRRIVINGYEI